ncbi:transmembrane and coiled-coil domains protein 1-like isoform X2 [Lingula anatina]|uniref:Transmembrane and coiled-coil domains protein 1-like isoform X2 n=1 Tax=Lingula anatina TaxID=7574 RepID=A0A1S3IIE4_LINAN|nr:transmembrane and coiled-coil domains protein 1-like isoform X2 [Lingula anatina]|eukprot:XP_013397982.1 transmembrane and coiled-coil domains protein 1-like isoform X2 [Lingula anatina]
MASSSSSSLNFTDLRNCFAMESNKCICMEDINSWYETRQKKRWSDSLLRYIDSRGEAAPQPPPRSTSSLKVRRQSSAGYAGVRRRSRSYGCYDDPYRLVGIIEPSNSSAGGLTPSSGRPRGNENGSPHVSNHGFPAMLSAQGPHGSPQGIMKKSDAVKPPLKRKKSPLTLKKSGETASNGGSGGSGVAVNRPRSVSAGANTLAATLPTEEGATLSQEELQTVGEDSTVSSANGGSESGWDDTDTAAGDVDPHRTKAACEHLQHKIQKTKDLIKGEQGAKEKNVNEYLKLASGADKQQVQRIKTVFEKKNQKSAQSIAQLQKKLESYQRKLKDVETYGVSAHKPAKEVLRDMGQGIKNVGGNIKTGLTGFSGGVASNIRGATDAIVSKPRSFAHLIKNKFGSADNIDTLKNIEEGVRGHEVGKEYHGSGTLPSSFKYRSDEEDASSIASSSGPSGIQSGSSPKRSGQLDIAPPEPVDLEPLRQDIQEMRETQDRLHEMLESLKNTMQSERYELMKSLSEENKYRQDRLEEAINDLSELHQHEITNLKQEISSMEEKMEYQLEERTRDMQEMLESCQTRISKMELQQQQQQLISMEGVENANARALITKLINVVLAVLAVILVLVSTIANLLMPFLTTKVRLLSTVVMITLGILLYYNWPLIVTAWTHTTGYFTHILSGK